jgi:H+/gluconate symporter-like permease
MCIATNGSWSFVYWIIILVCFFVTSCVLFCYVCTAVLHTLVAALLARSQYPEGPATGHLDTGFSWFPCV